MKSVFVIRSSPDNVIVHERVLELLELVKGSEHKVESIFFTGEAASLAYGKTDDKCTKAIQAGYIEAKNEQGFDLLVCGRAYRESGFEDECCAKGFALSGNVELSELISICDRVVEF